MDLCSELARLRQGKTALVDFSSTNYLFFIDGNAHTHCMMSLTTTFSLVCGDYDEVQSTDGGYELCHGYFQG